MIPAPRLYMLAAALIIPMLLSASLPELAAAALVLNILLAAAALLDLLISPGPHNVHLEREVSPVLSAGVSNPAALHLHNHSQHSLTITLHDDPGPLCGTEHLPQTIRLAAFARHDIRYAIRPRQRGPSKLAAVYLRFPTRWKLWVRHQIRETDTPVRIYPDVRAVHRYELLARRNRLAELGVRTTRMPGQGREFERLREFRYGDEQRQIDWKATARQQTLVSREFTVERNQNLVILIDSGRFMRGETAGVSSLDYALNSGIMLSYTALGQGDNVSLMVFSDRVERFVGPFRGKPGIQQILRSTYDITSSPHPADYGAALEYLMTVQRKRALVILITFITDERQLQVIGEHLRLRSSPWLPMCALLQDKGLRALADEVPVSDLDAFQTAAAAQILSGQLHEVARLREQGVLIVDTPPELLSERLISEYLSIKARNLI